MPPLRRQHNAERSVTGRRGIVAAGQIVKGPSCSVGSKRFVLFCLLLFRLVDSRQFTFVLDCRSSSRFACRASTGGCCSRIKWLVNGANSTTWRNHSVQRHHNISTNRAVLRAGMASADVIAYNLAAFITLLFLLEFGADRFIDHTAIIVHRVNVSQAVIGLLTAGAEWEEVK